MRQRDVLTVFLALAWFSQRFRRGLTTSSVRDRDNALKIGIKGATAC